MITSGSGSWEIETGRPHPCYQPLLVNWFMFVLNIGLLVNWFMFVLNIGLSVNWFMFVLNIGLLVNWFMFVLS